MKAINSYTSVKVVIQAAPVLRNHPFEEGTKVGTLIIV